VPVFTRKPDRPKRVVPLLACLLAAFATLLLPPVLLIGTALVGVTDLPVLGGSLTARADGRRIVLVDHYHSVATGYGPFDASYEVWERAIGPF
jgi:hypothetical protein